MGRVQQSGVWEVRRPELERRLDAALTHRLTTLIAVSGYGKSTLLRRWTDDAGGVLITLQPEHGHATALATVLLGALRLRVPDLPGDAEVLGGTTLGPSGLSDAESRAAAVATTLTGLLAPRLRRHLVLALDDLEVIDEAAEAVRFVETLVRTAPARLHLVVASRTALRFPVERLRQHRDVLELDATDLALSDVETKSWCEQVLGAAAAEESASVWTATGGWPALVHARLDARRSGVPAHGPEVATTSGAPTPYHALITAEYEALDPALQRVLRQTTVLPLLTTGLATALGGPADALDRLASRGVFVVVRPEGCRLTDTCAQVLAAHAPLAADEVASVTALAIGWYVEHGRIEQAVRTALSTDDPDRLADLLEAHGPALLGRPEVVIEGMAGLRADIRERPAMQCLAGIAHHNLGDWGPARSLLARVAQGPSFDALVAHRLGFIEHLRGELDRALDLYLRGADHGVPAADAAVCTAMAASVHWLRGDRDGCAALADEAMAAATQLHDARALAASHTVVAMLAALDGDRRANDAHYLRALHYAQAAGDTIQEIRIRSNRASHHQEEGAYLEALAELEIAERLAEATGFGWFLALALSNRAEVLLRLGRLEEAAADAATAAAHWKALGSHFVVYALNHRARGQVLRGDHEAAESTFRLALANAEAAGEVHGRVEALSGLSELLTHDDPDEAQGLADRALAEATGMTAVTACVSAARLALVTNAHDRARRLLDQAGELAEERRDRPGAAAVAEVRAALEQDPLIAQEAVSRWQAVGDPVGGASAELVLAELGEPEVAARIAGRVAERMQAIGCRALDDRIAAARTRSTAPSHALEVHTLGTFRVRRGEVVVARSEWQSRKARELLKILAAQRGRPIPREQVAALLWPDARDEQAALKRLNVQVSTLRAILDPGRELIGDHVVVSADGALRLDLAHVTVDVEMFCAAVASATRLDREGRAREALEHWHAAESAYTGDFLAEDPYADWASSLREEVRLGYGQAASRLADAEEQAGRHDAATRYRLRLLELDPHHEPTHLALIRSLVAAGRHGDARRRYRLYSERMWDIGIEPASYPSVDDSARP